MAFQVRPRMKHQAMLEETTNSSHDQYSSWLPRAIVGTAYAFLEYGTDLSSGRALEGNPTEYYRKAGSGMSMGVGMKILGACRFEVARDCNAGKNSFLINWGERF
jgi:hypothetical protein